MEPVFEMVSLGDSYKVLLFLH